MASSQHSSSSTSPSQGCVDPIDIDSFIKYEAISYQSPSISPSVSRSHSAVRPSSSINPNNTLLPPDSNQTFSGPSHQYGNYKQQTGLPAGALSTTHAVNQNNNAGFFRSGSGYNTSFDMGSREEIVDFNALAMNDTEMDFDLQNMFMSNEGSAFIDPSVLGGSEDTGADLDLVQSQPSNVGRLYPGAHQQQAALVKQQQQQARPVVPQQQQQRSSRAQATDPIAEKKISQLLKSMRQSSVATSNSDDDALNGGNLAVHRIKKDEDDMDEDERLLASEEGKKLSSKERRQLRNKVSARAFRSRRKEYIGQLEAEINAKTNESSDLRMQNKALMLENTRLTDLTRMLLSSPAFSTFLDEMSSESIPMQSQATQTQQRSEPAQPNVNKDANPFAVAQSQSNNPGHNGPQVGMTLIPDNAIDLFSPMTGVGNVYNNWNTNQPQVFSVMELPEGPSFDEIDTSVLSGKSSSSTPILSSIESKVEAPVVERPSMPEAADINPSISTDDEDVEWDESDPSFALFIDAPISTNDSNADQTQLFGVIPLEKAFARLELVAHSDGEASSGDVSVAAMDRFERIRASSDAIIDRIDRITGHL